MIKAQLLLLLALVGPFCATAHARTIPTTTDWDLSVTEGAGIWNATNAAEDTATPGSTDAPESPTTVISQTPAHTTDATHDNPTEAITTEASTVQAETNAPPVTTEVVEEITTKSVIEEETGATPTVLVEEEEIDDGLGTGKIVGIAIVSLVALIAVIAVAVTVAKRMGRYSP